MNNIRYADETVLIADSGEELGRLIEKLTQENTLNISFKKTEMLLISKKETSPRIVLKVN